MNEFARRDWERGVRYWRYRENGADGYSANGEWICSHAPAARIPVLLLSVPTFVVEDEDVFDRQVFALSNDPRAFVVAFADFFRNQPVPLGEFEARCLEHALDGPPSANDVLLLMHGVRNGAARKRKLILQARRKKERKGKQLSKEDDLRLIDRCEDLRIAGILAGERIVADLSLIRAALQDLSARPASLQDADLKIVYDRFRQRECIQRYLAEIKSNYKYLLPF